MLAFVRADNTLEIREAVFSHFCPDLTYEPLCYLTTQALFSPAVKQDQCSFFCAVLQHICKRSKTYKTLNIYSCMLL